MTTTVSVREHVAGTEGLGQHAGASRQSDTFVSTRLSASTTDISTRSLHFRCVELAAVRINALMAE